MHHSTQGIVLNCTCYKDNAYIVSIFTRDFGKVSYSVHHPQGKRAKIRKHHLQPLSLLEMEVQHRENKDIQQLGEVKLQPISYDLYDNPLKISICFFMAEVIDKSTESINADADLFDFLQQSISLLATTQSISHFALLFLLDYAKYIGIYPYDELDNEWIRLQAKEDQRIIQLLLDQCSSLSGSEKRKAMQLLIAYYRYYLPGMGELKSLSVLSEVFSI